MSKTEINDYLSKCDEDLAKSVMYRVYGMPGPIFMEEDNDTPTPEPGPEPPTPPTPSYTTPFYVENITDEDETLTFTCYLDDLPITIETSTDASNWDTLGTIGEGDSSELTAQLQPNNKLYIRATTDTWCKFVDSEGIPVGCTISGISKVGGNIMSLLYGSNFTGEETTFPSNSTHNFAGLFYSNYDLISASELILPATTLTDSCYMHMFSNCSSLTTAPSLPATTLTDSCYMYMFYICSSLTTAPAILPATTLADFCYQGMFCCTSLTTAPELPATTLAEACYCDMFRDCDSLNYIKCLATDISASNCTDNWLSHVAETGTFVKAASMTDWTTGNGIPEGWTVENATN